MQAKFLVNLRPLTASQEFVDGLGPSGYLAPPAYLTAATKEFARNRPAAASLIVDNGRFDDIGVIVRRMAEVAPPADAEDAANPRRGNALAGGDAPPVNSVLRQVRHLASGRAPTIDLAAQLALAPNGVVGEEDIVPAAMLRLGYGASAIPDSRRLMRRVNARVLRRVRESVDKIAAAGRHAGVLVSVYEWADGAVRYYPVLSALDYDTAFDAGRLAAQAGFIHGALGFGAFMADDSYVRRFKKLGRWHSLPAPMPNRYIGTALVAKGVWDGWVHEVGKPPVGFHFLGLGAPIMLGMVARIAGESSLVTFDATSPIRDAGEGTLYFREPALLKIRTRRLAARLANDPDFNWPCSCPFCAAYLGEFPFDREGATLWRRRNPDRSVTAADLRATGPLGQLLPLLAEPLGGAARKRLELARSGHNHWILERIVDDINVNATSRERLSTWVHATVTDYEAATSSVSFARAVRFAYELSVGA